jgi:phenylacetate-CoA ligase
MPLMEGSEFISDAEIFAWQETAWAKQRLHVERNSEFFRQLWDGKTPPKTLRDLATLPLSDKAGLRQSQMDHPSFGNYFATSRSKAVRLHRTSGTTGQAMNLALSAHDCKVTEVVGGRCHRAAGLTPEHTVVHCLN